MTMWMQKGAVLVLCWFMGSVHAFTSQNTALILSFNELVRAVESGNDVKAIVYLDRCRISDPALQNQLRPNLIGASTRFNFTQYLHYRPRIDGQLKDTVTTVINSVVELPTPGVFWSVYGRLSVFDDDTATLYVDYYDPASKQSHLQIEWVCDISVGNDANGLLLINGF
ncbi:hypothetical protein [Legionella worsleiensis]|uniref:VirK protein n=1 Tax=Legionella worsleiensis TaxID=45076 RepID=A0A0W1AKR3_9GAMM|nr:hypothetical protein [Legionella worsleiensis]KTD81947.1 hypothetical protein Lwor_0250 [Legionella worsleiensis]STY31307.1 Uncharacterised protein [Legionella worsleiensis]